MPRFSPRVVGIKRTALLRGKRQRTEIVRINTVSQQHGSAELECGAGVGGQVGEGGTQEGVQGGRWRGCLVFLSRC